MANAGPRGGSEGEQLGSYRLVRKLGRGGMGEVWLAEHDTIKSQVAIKLVLAAPDDEDAASRFLREAKATARIRHPGVVTVSDFGPRPAGGAYLVMELLDGESLAERLERGPLASDLAIDVGVQIAEALAAAHASGVVHRDLKPANIFLVRDAATRSDVRVKLVDFGVAKATGKVTDELGVTVTGALVGTPVYMAPEQCTTRKGPVDHRADLYALGVVLYEMLVGKPPFRGPTLGDLIDQHLNETPASPRTSVPSLPAKLDVLIMRLLAKEKADRPSSANEVARLLHELRGTQPPPSLDETLASGARGAPSRDASIDRTVDGSIDRTVASGAVPASRAQPASPRPAVTNLEHAPRSVPKALIWGLVGGFALFGAILVVIVMNRERLTPEAPPIPADPATACEKGDAKACVSLADREMVQSKPDLTRIVAWLQTACSRTDQRACVRVAMMYMSGAGVRADVERAFAMATAACEKNEGEGCDLAGDLVPPGPDRPKQSFAYYTRGCELGSAFACHSAGRRQKFGLGAPVDTKAAEVLLARSTTLATTACEGGDAVGCRLLGISLVRGEGITKDGPAGFAKLQRACDLGSPEACGEAGEQLAMGAQGINKDPERAKALLETGCDRGAANACVTLGIAYAYGLLGPADANKGFGLVKSACMERSPRTCSILGNFYKTGTGTTKDLALAQSAYKRGCDGTEADSCAQLAKLELPGETSDETTRARLLQQSCDLGSGYGCKIVGDRAYRSGDFRRALEMYELACAMSDMQNGCTQAATAYIEGRGTPEDLSRGRGILEYGCRNGAMVSCHSLGMRLRDGRGFAAEPTEALRILEEACGLGWAESCIAAAEMFDSTAFGVARDSKRAAVLRERGCKVDPKMCGRTKVSPSGGRAESPE